MYKRQAKHALYIALQTLVNPGDEIILPAPFWVSYYELIRMVGAVPVVLDATEASHFKLTAEQLSAAITPRTKALILNNPSNPTGMVYSLSLIHILGSQISRWMRIPPEIPPISPPLYCVW